MANEITIDMIKELRERTGIGMIACKKALTDANGDMELAITNLRKSGMASAVKKEGRTTNEGQIGSFESPEAIALVEVNAETDFVVKNDKFQEFVKTLAEQAAKSNPASLEAFLKEPYSKDSSMTIDEFRANLVQTIGENIQVRRVQTFPKKSGESIGVYSHLGGKILVAVELSGQGEEKLAKDIAMHIAAASPQFLSPERVPQEVLSHEKEIIRSQVPKDKPDAMKEKIVEGKLQAFYKEQCLTEQPYIRDDKMSVAQLVQARGKESGKALAIASFTRWDVGR